jgi:hypothetical protein
MNYHQETWYAYWRKYGGPKWEAKFERQKMMVAALNNMPAINDRQCNLGLYGQQSALARCLGVRIRGRFSNNSIYHAFQRGSKFSDDRMAILEKLAGPDGATYAEELLAKAGPTKHYNIWPNEMASIGGWMP